MNALPCPPYRVSDRALPSAPQQHLAQPLSDKFIATFSYIFLQITLANTPNFIHKILLDIFLNLCVKVMYKIQIIKNQPTFEQKILKKIPKKILKKLPSFVELIQVAIEQLTDRRKA
ncbi:MAG: hypothetical protein WCD53_10280 [Microcoleus sp.]